MMLSAVLIALLSPMTCCGGTILIALIEGAGVRVFSGSLVFALASLPLVAFAGIHAAQLSEIQAGLRRERGETQRPPGGRLFWWAIFFTGELSFLLVVLAAALVLG